MTPKQKKNIFRDLKGYLYISPMLLGILFFIMIPMAVSLYFSFFDYSVISPPKNFGLQNYIGPFKSYGWIDMSKSLKVTLIYTVIAVPLSMALSYSLALLLNSKVKGIGVFRLIFYLPVIIPAVIAGLIWRDIGNVDFGMANILLDKIGIRPYTWFSQENSALPSLIIFGLFGIGGGMVLWLAQLKAIPPVMYEAARIDGAGFWIKLFTVTIPMCTPMIFYNLILGIIGALQTGIGIFPLTGGTPGPNNSLYFYCIKVYYTAFNFFQMGLACALSWMLFVFIGLLTILVFKTSKWVFYGENA